MGLGLLYQLLYLLPGEGIGYGDVRLAVLLGLFLGWLGWAEVVGGALLPWLVNGPVVLGLLLAGRVHRKSRLPFGPAMLRRRAAGDRVAGGRTGVARLNVARQILARNDRN